MSKRKPGKGAASRVGYDAAPAAARTVSNAAARTCRFSRSLARDIMAGNLLGRILTRDGRPVRILAWDAMGVRSIVGLIYMGDLDAELSWQWTKRGKSDIRPNVKTPTDLVIELQEKSTVPRLRRGPNKKKRK